MTEKIYCQDYGDNPECLGEADPEYTMDYTDVEPGAYIHWCSHCGLVAHMMEKLICELSANDPTFVDRFEKAITEVEQTRFRDSH